MLIRRAAPASRRADGGTATIEFALVAPLLISLLLGICDIAPSTMAHYKLGNATQSVADLATQYPNLQPSDMANVFAGGGAVLSPFSSAKLVLRVTNVVSDGAGKAFVYWSCSDGSIKNDPSFAPYPAKSPVTATPTGSPLRTVLLLNDSKGANTSYVSVEAQYIYTAPAEFVMKGPQTMSVVAYMVPRQSTYVGFPWDGTKTNPPPLPMTTNSTGSTTLSNGAICNYSY